jgi:hypothetical protein
MELDYQAVLTSVVVKGIGTAFLVSIMWKAAGWLKLG